MPGAARALVSTALAALVSVPAQGAPEARPSCTGPYADTLAAMDATSRERESRARADWIYCLRATAVYEHISYGRGGKIVHEYHTKSRHGTGFGYRRRGAEWLVVTNHHVVWFPEVTGDVQDLDGVPPGSRRVREEVRIVASEAEPDSPDQIVLRPVLEDEPLDIAILASREPLKVVPYRFGRSADLRIGNAVLARGYPLGAFMAANAGHVIGLGQRDLEHGWDHEDFAVDALLNLGSSGSPVLAVSCQTGEPEVVGIYHAAYRNAQGLNVVIAIDQLREVLEELRSRARAAGLREPLPHADPAEARAALTQGPIIMPFGRRAMRVDRQGDVVRFALLDPAFPLSSRVDLAIVDRGAAAEGRAAELRAALWEQLALVIRYRTAEDGTDGSHSPEVRERIAARLRRGEQDQEELLAALRAGTDGFGLVTHSERHPGVRRTAEGQDRSAREPLELVLGAR